MDRVFEREVVVIPVGVRLSQGVIQYAMSLRHPELARDDASMWKAGLEQPRREPTHRFSRNVFALTWFLPIALAFHAQKEPDGSTW